MNAMNPALVVDQLHKTFQNGPGTLSVLDGISFNASPGEIVAMLGPSGCGKSTILRCVAGLTDHQGRILIGNDSPSVLRSKKGIGCSFQEPGLIDWRTAFDNILLPAEIGATSIPMDLARERAEELLKVMGLEKFRDFHPGELSGGMKQRVALARSLLLDPLLLLMDEPFSALDSLTRTKLVVHFERVLRDAGTTTMLITHDVSEAIYMADTVYILSSLPARVIARIDVPFASRELGLMDQPAFTALVTEARHHLFNYAHAEA